MELSLELILLDQSYTNPTAAIQRVGAQMVAAGFIEPAYVEAMLRRNESVSVYLGNFVAMPHGDYGSEQYVKKDAVCLVQVPDGVAFGSPDQPQVVTLLFFVALQQRSISLMQNIAFLCSDLETIVQLGNAQTPAEIKQIIQQA